MARRSKKDAEPAPENVQPAGDVQPAPENVQPAPDM